MTACKSTRLRAPSACAAFCLVLLAAGFTSPAAAGGRATVNVTSDADDGSGGCTLREAIDSLNTSNAIGGCVRAAGTEDRVTFDPDLTLITLSLSGGQLDVRTPMEIVGPPGDTNLQINGTTSQSRIFGVTGSFADLTLTNLDLKSGVALAQGAPTSDCTATDQRGGAICALSDLTLIDSRVLDSSTNGAGGHGGGIAVEGLLTMTRSTVSANQIRGASAYGGGVYAGGGATIDDSRIDANSTLNTFGWGGGFYVPETSTLTMTNSVVSGNRTEGDSADGGGIHAMRLFMNRSTVSGNQTLGSAASGGGIVTGSGFGIFNSLIDENSVSGTSSNAGGMVASTFNGNLRGTLSNSTVTRNSASAADTVGGLLLIVRQATEWDLELTSTILAENTGPLGNLQRLLNEGQSVTINARNSMIGDPAGEIDGTNLNNLFSDLPQLSERTDAGCVTPAGDPDSATCLGARSPELASPARNAGASTFGGNFDQRGFSRSVGGQPDIGAIETRYPEINAFPGEIPFGNRTIGTLGTFELSINAPEGATTVSDILSDDPAFFVVPNEGTCGPVPFTIIGGGFCRIIIGFQPQSVGAVAGNLSIFSGDPNSPEIVSLSGNGTAPAGLTLSPSRLDFGEQELGVQTSSQTVTLESNGDLDLQIGLVGLERGGSPAPFIVLADTCSGARLPPGTTCSVELAFEPLVPGITRDRLTVPTNAPVFRSTVDLIGTNDVMFFDDFDSQ